MTLSLESHWLRRGRAGDWPKWPSCGHSLSWENWFLHLRCMLCCQRWFQMLIRFPGKYDDCFQTDHDTISTLSAIVSLLIVQCPCPLINFRYILSQTMSSDRLAYDILCKWPDRITSYRILKWLQVCTCNLIVLYRTYFEHCWELFIADKKKENFILNSKRA